MLVDMQSSVTDSEDDRRWWRGNLGDIQEINTRMNVTFHQCPTVIFFDISNPSTGKTGMMNRGRDDGWEAYRSLGKLIVLVNPCF
jgi:hypothetical protein